MWLHDHENKSLNEQINTARNTCEAQNETERIFFKVSMPNLKRRIT
jgi:hypothetical protein